MGSEELKPCPFCGSSAKLDSGDSWYWVECMSCHAETTGSQSKSKAINLWNNRPHENKIKAEAVREAADATKTEFYVGNEKGCSYPELIIYANKMEQSTEHKPKLVIPDDALGRIKESFTDD